MKYLSLVMQLKYELSWFALNKNDNQSLYFGNEDIVHTKNT